MAYQKLILLAPCHGLEDFPLYHTGEDAASLLASWTALWHPLFIASAVELPHVERSDYPPEDLNDALLLLPKPCESELDQELPGRVESLNSKLIEAKTTREEILAEALPRYGNAAETLDQDLVNDFFAFGFAFLMVEVLTQQMRYASSIDQTRIKRDIQEAAQAVIDGDVDLCREKLTNCHDALADERSHYYPVEVYLVDLTLLATATSTLGSSLDLQLRDSFPQNLMADAQALEALAAHNHAALENVRETLDHDKLGLAGGEYEQLPLPLMTFETAVRQFYRGANVYDRLVGQQPNCFARRRHGIYASLAQVVSHAGLSSALHLKFDVGQLPESTQGKTSWQHGTDELLDAYARAPLDASIHETFLNLPTYLSETMDSDHVATRMFVHWPGVIAPWYDDLRRCGRYGNALGRFVTLQEYFREAVDTTSRDAFGQDDYVYSHLQQAAAATKNDPISKWPKYWAHSVLALSARGLAVMASAVGVSVKIDALCDVESQLDTTPNRELHPDLQTAVRSTQHELDNALTKPNDHTTVVYNPFSFPRRIRVQSANEHAATGSAVYASERRRDGRVVSLIDVPAMGFAQLEFNAAAQPPQGPPLAEELTLGNEYFQATIDAETGALRSLRDYGSRKTRLSQQLAFRISLPKTGQPWVDRQAPVAYTVMAADSVEITENGQIYAEITARGRLLALNGEQIGDFVQKYQIQRGSRILTLDIEITPQADVFHEDPWDSYYAARFAFGDESAVLRTGARMQTHDVSRRRLESPLFVDIDCAEKSTTILSGGLPFHRRVADAQLDTILQIHNEKSCRFRLGVGVDLPSPMRAAIDFIAAGELPMMAEQRVASAEVGWLFHVDAKNTLVSWWEPIGSEGIRMHLVETDRRKSKARIQGCRPWKEAFVVDSGNSIVRELVIEDGVAMVDIGPHSFQDLRLHW